MALQRVTPSGDRPVTLDELVAEQIVVDVGAGDGRHAYHLAKQRPNQLVVGLEPVAANMRPTTVRAAKKPSRGGVANLVLVRGSVEEVPGSVLAGVADEVTVMLPWGRLLAGILLDDPAVKSGLVALGHDGTAYTIVLNCEIWVERTPADHADLPDPTPSYIGDVVAPAFASLGLSLAEVRYMAAEETASLRSSWARRLSHGRDHPRFLLVRGQLSSSTPLPNAMS